jgi:hypothetical protein
MRKVEFIEGWGLFRKGERLQKLGRLEAVGPCSGCTNKVCLHQSHDPAAPVYRWYPPEGAELFYLGCEIREFETKYEWYLLRLPDGEEKIIEWYGLPHYHKRIYFIPQEWLPAWIDPEKVKEEVNRNEE